MTPEFPAGPEVRLILNADDFGWSTGVNEAVCALAEAGIVTSTSLMVAAKAAPEAVRAARAHPGLAVGLHLVVVYGPALLPPADAPQIQNAEGELDHNCVRAGLRYTLQPGCHRELRREIEAQFLAFDCLNLGWSHVDSHLHFSLTPVVFRAMLDNCARYPVIGLRVPEDDYVHAVREDPGNALPQLPLALWFGPLCAWQRRMLGQHPYVTTRRCFGLYRTGRLTAGHLARLVRTLAPGDYELHCHPDFSTSVGRAEYEALRSPEFRDALNARPVRLVTYADLRGGSRVFATRKE